MNGDSAFIWAVIFAIGMGIGIGIGYGMSSRAFEAEAYKRGHMVRCIGIVGYYWECPE